MSRSFVRVEKAIRAAAPLALVGLLAAPSAAEPPAIPTRVVQYADLNLQRPEGVAALYGRIQRAAETVCRSLEGRRAADAMGWRECRTRAVDEAVGRVALGALTELHLAQTGERPRARSGDLAGAR